jgi:hypothetical protein
MSSYNYGDILSGLNDLYNLTSECDLKFNNDINDVLQVINDNIPRIIVWGDQSCGKSSLLNKMFGLNLETHEGLTTICPLEIRSGPNYETTDIYIIDDNKKITFTTPIEAQQYVRDKNDKLQKKTSFDVIIMEQPGGEDNIVIDMVGCTVELSEYNNELAQKYFNKPNTTILHLLRADVDSAVDNSFQYLKNVNAKIIKVFTFVDGANSRESGYVKKYVNESIALVNNKRNELKENEKYCVSNGINIDSNNIINGTNKLFKTCSSILKQQIEQLHPMFIKAITNLYEQINIELDSIGNIPPNPKDVCYIFRKELIELIHNKIKNNTELEEQLKGLKDSISRDNLHEIKDDILPSIDEIYEEIKNINSDADIIKGTEGCYDTVKKYISEIVETAELIINTYLTEYLEELTIRLIAIISKSNIKYNDYTKQYINKVLHEIIELKNKLHSEILRELKQKLNEIKNCSNTESDEYDTYDVDNEYINEIIDYVIKETTKPNIKINEKYIEQIKKNVLDISFDSTMFRAKKINHIISSYWYVKCKDINESTLEKVYYYRKIFIEEINKFISSIESSDVIEPPDLKNKRTSLNEIKTICVHLKTNLCC